MQFYSNSNDFYQFIQEIHDEKLCIIISDTLGKDVVRKLEMNKQIYSIYISCNDRQDHENWTKDFQKIKGIYTNLRAIHDAFRRDIRQEMDNLTSIHILSNEIQNQPFSCSLLLREILINSESSEEMKQSFIEFSRYHYAGNANELNRITQFENDGYNQFSSIEWYTRECFLSAMIHRALRLVDMEILVKIAFFISDLHKQINDLHTKSTDHEKLTVYYNQVISNEQFQNFNMKINDIISFRTFLLTTIDRQPSFNLAKQFTNDSNLTSILFRIEIDRTISSFPFVSLDQLDYYHDSDRHILFSLNPIFQITQIERIEENKLWQIHLILIDNNHEQLKARINSIQNEYKNLHDFSTLGRMMIKTNQLDKAKDIFQILLKTTSNTNNIHRYLGYIYEKIKDYSRALSHYRSSLDGELQNKPVNHSTLAGIYAHIGMIEKEQNDFVQASKTFTNALKIVLNPHTLDLSMAFILMNNLGEVFISKGDYPNALKSFQEALKASRKSNSLKLEIVADIHQNLSLVFDTLGQNNEAVQHASDAINIAKQKYGENHDKLKKYQDQYNRITQKLQLST
ncbi:hypothetical protein I4U23_024997 [Adineta vaga]|nr:hypothetical protein I4U23_024997 [Adineta vaga]